MVIVVERKNSCKMGLGIKASKGKNRIEGFSTADNQAFGVLML